MQFRHVFAAALVAVCGVLSSNAANAATVRVDLLSGVDPGPPAFQNAYVGTTVHFDPGTYEVTFATGGNYGGYDGCGVSGCVPNPGFQDGFAINTGGGVNGPGVYYNIPFVVSPPNTPYGSQTFYYATPADATLAYQAAEGSNGLLQSISNAPYVPLIGPITFTLVTAADVNFNMQEGCCWSYITGGMSLDVTQLDVSTTPLPAALPLFATGLGALGLVARRRKRKVAAALAA